MLDRLDPGPRLGGRCAHALPLRFLSQAAKVRDLIDSWQLSSIFPPLRVTHPRYPCPVPTHCRIWAFPPQNNSMYIYSTSEKAWELLSFFAWGTVNGYIMIYLSVKPDGLCCFWTAGSYPRARPRARQLHPLQHCDEICPLSADSINCVCEARKQRL